MSEKPTTSDRCALATATAEHLQEFCDARHPGLMKVHWDDCDMDNHMFWFHFAAPSLASVRRAGSIEMKQASALALACAREAEAFLSECPYSVNFWWSRWDNPQGVYRTVCGRKEFDHYESATWIKVLSFYG